MAFGQLYQDLLNSVNMMYQLSGLNEATADAPSPDMNQMGQQFAATATSNALFLISDADKYLQLSLADCLIQKLQIAVRLGKVEGYVKALGRNTVEFFQLGEEIASPREFGISIQDIPTGEERQLLYQRLIQADSQGLLDPSVMVIFERIDNLDEAAEYLAYEIGKAKERFQQEQQQNIQLQAQSNLQAMAAAEEEKRKTLILQHQLNMELENLKLQELFIT